MRRPVERPTLDEHGDETHPAWGLISASRGQHSPPGSVLFDSDIRHQHTVTVRSSTARRKRNLMRDWFGEMLPEFEDWSAPWKDGPIPEPDVIVPPGHTLGAVADDGRTWQIVRAGICWPDAATYAALTADNSPAEGQQGGRDA